MVGPGSSPGAEEEAAPGPQHSVELGDPSPLEVGGQMGEHRDGKHQVEPLVLVREGWCETVDRERGEPQVLPAPGNQGWVVVGAVYFGRWERGPLPEDPAT